MHVAAWLKALEAEGSSRPTVKRHLAAVRMLFDWLVVGQIVPYNPAHAVRAPKHVVKRGKTPVLSTEEMHDLFAGFPADSLVALGDRALLATMAYTFARIGAGVQLRVEDYQELLHVKTAVLNGRLNYYTGMSHSVATAA